MSKTALIFLLAIFVPALLLGGLALKTAGKQRMILEQQEAELQQRETDALATEVRLALSAEHQSFAEGVNRLLAQTGPEVLAQSFSRRLGEVWSQAGVGFAVTMEGAILSPSEGSEAKARAAAQRFLAENSDFLRNRIAVEVYNVTPDVQSKLAAAQTPAGDKLDAGKSDSSSSRWRAQLRSRSVATPARGGEAKAKLAQPRMEERGENEAAVPQAESASQALAEAASDEALGAAQSDETVVQKEETRPEEKRQTEMAKYVQQRKVAPQIQQMPALSAPISRLNVETNWFSQIVEEQTSGIISRFVQDELEILFWVRPPAAPNIVFGVQLDTADLGPLLAPLVTEGPPDVSVCLAILDDHARPFAKSLPDFVANWKTPFVATEIGEVLPHWEVVLYLTDPGRLARSARLVQLTLVALIALALGAIAFGSYLVVADTRRQLALAQKKTDFVSNVSHELKTPLTSIRMFAELLHEGRVRDEDKKRNYLRIITLEAERLTRLINNVLDFAKIEKNRKRYNKRPIDLHPVIRKAWEPVEAHLEGEGFATGWEAGPPPYRVCGDEDALAQVIVNLLSNAEKYSTETRSVELHSYVMDGWVCVSVLDCGNGVPAGEEKKIFEHFYRAHDSLSSGIQGSGLGLTLALRIAEDHGGTIVFERRKGGGSCFTLRLPEAPATDSDS